MKISLLLVLHEILRNSSSNKFNMRISASFLCIRSQILKPTELNIQNLQLHQYLKTFYCREILIMLSVFDTIFVVTATISFSLPILSHSWNVNIWLGSCFDQNISQIFPDIIILRCKRDFMRYFSLETIK